MVLVLWLIVLLTVVASGHGRNAHIETRLAARLVDTTTSLYVAEAAVNIAILEILSRQSGVIDHRPAFIKRILLGHEAIVAIRPASGLVDLNSASPGLLNALYLAVTGDESTATALTDATLDWRDRDNLRHLNGSEDDDYLVAGLPWSARDGDFLHIEELRYVQGMTGDIYDQVAPYITVYSRQSGLDIASAPDFLVRALTGTELDGMGGAQAARSPVHGSYHVAVIVDNDRSGETSIEVIVSIDNRDDAQFQIIEWREPARVSFAGGSEMTL